MFSRETESHRDIFNDLQLKSLMEEFLILAGEETNGSVEAMLNRFPIMDAVMVHVIRSMMFYLGINEEFEKKIHTEILFVRLS